MPAFMSCFLDSVCLFAAQRLADRLGERGGILDLEQDAMVRAIADEIKAVLQGWWTLCGGRG